MSKKNTQDTVPRQEFDAFCARIANVISDQSARITNLEMALRLRGDARQESDAVQAAGGFSRGAFSLVKEKVRDRILAPLVEEQKEEQKDEENAA